MNKITGRELDPNQFPAWAEFTPSGEALTKVSARAGFEIEVLIDQVSGGVTTKAMARVGAGIIESGYVSGRGWYVKYSDGTMEAWYVSPTLQALTMYDAQNGYYNYIQFTFPVPFYDKPIVAQGHEFHSGANVTGAGYTTTALKTVYYMGSHIAGNDAYPGYHAIGRWKA